MAGNRPAATAERHASRPPLRSGRVSGALESAYFSEGDRFLRRGQVFSGVALLAAATVWREAELA